MGKRWNLSLRNMEIDSKIALPIFEKRRNFSLITRYSLKFTLLSLLVVKSLVTRCKIRSLGVAEVARCKKSLVTCCRIRSLQRLLVTCYKICSLLVAEVVRCKKIIRYSLQKLIVAKNHSLFVAKFARYSLQKFTRHTL